MNAKDLSEPKYEYLIKKRKDVVIKHVNNPNAFIECSNTMDDVYENIHDYNPNRRRISFEFIIKKHKTLTENPQIQIYPNKIKNRIVFKIKAGYKLEVLTPETMKLLGSTKKDFDSNKNSDNVPKLESDEVVLVYCNLVKNDCQHTSKVLFSFLPNKQFRQLINISLHSLTMMNTVNTEFSFVEVWFTDQISKALEIEDYVNLMLIIG